MTELKKIMVWIDDKPYTSDDHTIAIAVMQTDDAQLPVITITDKNKVDKYFTVVGGVAPTLSGRRFIEDLVKNFFTLMRK